MATRNKPTLLSNSHCKVRQHAAVWNMSAPGHRPSTHSTAEDRPKQGAIIWAAVPPDATAELRPRHGPPSRMPCTTHSPESLTPSCVRPPNLKTCQAPSAEPSPPLPGHPLGKASARRMEVCPLQVVVDDPLERGAKVTFDTDPSHENRDTRDRIRIVSAVTVSTNTSCLVQKLAQRHLSRVRSGGLVHIVPENSRLSSQRGVPDTMGPESLRWRVLRRGWRRQPQHHAAQLRIGQLRGRLFKNHIHQRRKTGSIAIALGHAIQT